MLGVGNIDALIRTARVLFSVRVSQGFPPWPHGTRRVLDIGCFNFGILQNTALLTRIECVGIGSRVSVSIVSVYLAVFSVTVIAGKDFFICNCLILGCSLLNILGFLFLSLKSSTGKRK